VFAVKPPIEELQYFLEFQIPTQWSTPESDLTLGQERKEPVCPVMQFSLMGPKLYISTTQVSEHNRLVVCFETESVHYAFGSTQRSVRKTQYCSLDQRHMVNSANGNYGCVSC